MAEVPQGEHATFSFLDLITLALVLDAIPDFTHGKVLDGIICFWLAYANHAIGVRWKISRYLIPFAALTIFAYAFRYCIGIESADMKYLAAGVLGAIILIGTVAAYSWITRHPEPPTSATTQNPSNAPAPTPESSKNQPSEQKPARKSPPVKKAALQEKIAPRTEPSENIANSPQPTAPQVSANFSDPKATSASQLPSHIHFSHMYMAQGMDISGCVYCSVTDSYVPGGVKLGTGPVLLDHNVIGKKINCEKREHPLKDVPNDCQSVAIINNGVEANSALDNTEGTIGEAYVSGNIVRPPLGGGPAKSVENYHGEIQKLTDTNNDVGWASGSTPPLPTASALHGSNSGVADQLAQFIDRGHEIEADFLKDNNAELIDEKEKTWDANAEAAVAANLGQRFGQKFDEAKALTASYPQGHSAKGGSIYNLIDAKIAVLATFINQLRAASH
jgi:hypothetical protein